MSAVPSTKFDKQIEKSSHLLKCLADKNRLKVFAILTYGSYTVSQIYKCLLLRQNLISHHLKVLHKEGFVDFTRQGREVYYSINKENLKELDLTFAGILKPLEGTND